MGRGIRAIAIIAGCLTLTAAGCGLLPAAPGTLDAAGGPCGLSAAGTTTGTSAPAAGPGGPGQALTDAPGAIRFAPGSDDIGWLQPLIDAWNAGHRRDPVQAQYLPPTEGDQLAQLTANLQAKSCFYDVIDMDVVWTAQFAGNGWIIPLDPGQ